MGRTLPIPSLVEGRSEENIVLDRFILDPRLLRRICHSLTSRQVEPAASFEWVEVHLAKKTHEYGRLARSRRTDDEVDASRLKEYITREGESETPPRRATAVLGGPSEPSVVEPYYVDALHVAVADRRDRGEAIGADVGTTADRPTSVATAAPNGAGLGRPEDQA